MPAQNRNVGFVFQHYAAFKHMTVDNNVAFGLKIRKRPGPRSRSGSKRAARAGAARGLSTATRRSCRADSASGWRSPARSRWSRRCCCSTSRSARSTRRCGRAARWLRRLHEEVHVTTIFVTHDQEEAMEVAEQIVVMNEGPGRAGRRPARALRAARERVRDDVRRHREPPRHDVGAPARHRGLTLHLEPQAEEAMVDRIVHLGFEFRLEMTLADGSPLLGAADPGSGRELELAGRSDRLHQADPADALYRSSSGRRSRRPADLGLARVHQDAYFHHQLTGD